MAARQAHRRNASLSTSASGHNMTSPSSESIGSSAVSTPVTPAAGERERSGSTAVSRSSSVGSNINKSSSIGEGMDTLTAKAPPPPPPPPPQDDKARRRAKNLLKQFYGMEKKDEDKSSPLDINGNNFNPDLFQKKMLAEKSLDELMQIDNTYNTEAKSLDGEMKTLVYENYNKFISATDVIKRMRTNVEDMESQMDELRQTMQKITDGSSKVNTKLVQKRNKINQLAGVAGLIRKIEFVFQLPARLKKCVETEAYGQAWRYYSRTASVLSHYSHLPSFAPIKADCDKIMKQVAVKLNERLGNELTKPHDLTEAVQILLGLKEPASKLVKSYVKSQRQALHLSLERATAFDPSDPEAFGAQANDDANNMSTYRIVDPKMLRQHRTPSSSSASTDEANQRAKPSRYDPFLRLAYLHETFLRELMEFVQTFTRLFVNPVDVSKLELSDKDRKAADDDLWHVVDDIAKEYFATVEGFLEAKSNQIGSRNYVDALARLEDDVHSFDRHLNGRSKLITRARHLTNQFLLNYARREFTAVGSNFHDRLLWLQTVCRTLTSSGAAADEPKKEEVKKDDASVASSTTEEAPPKIDELNELVHSIAAGLSRSLNEALTRLEVFAITDEHFMHAHLPAYVQAAFREAANLWTSVGNTMLQFGMQKDQTAGAPLPLLTLLLSKLSWDLENTAISNLYARMFEIMSSGVRRSAVNSDIADARSMSKKNGEKLLLRYVELNGLTMASMIRLAVDTRNWVTAREPRRVSKLWDQIVEDLGTIETHVEQLYDENHSHSRQSSESSRRNPARLLSTSTAGPGSSSGRKEKGAFGDAYMSNIDKLFRERIEVFGPVETHKHSIVAAVVKIVLKTFSESIRQRTFGRSGFQQMQLDIEYLRTHLWRFASEKMLNNMLEEALTGAQSRCVDPIPMEPSVIDKLLGADADA